MVLIGPYQYPCERMQSFYFINDFSMGMTVAHIFNVKTEDESKLFVTKVEINS